MWTESSFHRNKKARWVTGKDAEEQHCGAGTNEALAEHGDQRFRGIGEIVPVTLIRRRKGGVLKPDPQRRAASLLLRWCRHKDSNPGPSAYKADALAN